MKQHREIAVSIRTYGGFNVTRTAKHLDTHTMPQLAAILAEECRQAAAILCAACPSIEEDGLLVELSIWSMEDDEFCTRTQVEVKVDEWTFEEAVTRALLNPMLKHAQAELLRKAAVLEV
jgi:hypothetical protein